MCLGYRGKDLEAAVRAFQTTAGIAETGRIDAATVKGAKSQLAKFRADVARGKLTDSRMKTYSQWGMVAAVVLLLHLLGLLYLQLRLRARRKQLGTLAQLLSELNTRSLPGAPAIEDEAVKTQ